MCLRVVEIELGRVVRVNFHIPEEFMPDSAVDFVVSGCCLVPCAIGDLSKADLTFQQVYIP